MTKFHTSTKISVKIARCDAHDGEYKDYSTAVCDAVYI